MMWWIKETSRAEQIDNIWFRQRNLPIYLRNYVQYILISLRHGKWQLKWDVRHMISRVL